MGSREKDSRRLQGHRAQPGAQGAWSVRAWEPALALPGSRPDSEMKVAPLAVAAARTNVVLLQPGGPCSSTPHGGFNLRR